MTMNTNGTQGAPATGNIKLPTYSTVFDRDAGSFNFRKPNKKTSSSEINSNLHFIPLGKKIFEGVLLEKNSKLSLWKEYKVVLFEDRMQFFSDEAFSKEVGILPLNNITVFRDQFMKGEAPSQKKIPINFYSNKKTITYYARERSELNLWIEKLRASNCIFQDFLEIYNLGEELGGGTFANVCIAKRKFDNLEFAVKIFNKKKLKDAPYEEARQYLVNEIQILRILDHPNIVKLYEIYESDKHVMLVMELVKGRPLHRRIFKHVPLTETMIKSIYRKVLETISYIHSKGIIHRDLKPENILFCNPEKMDIKIIDFGLSTFMAKGNFETCGTPGYVAPEVLTEKFYDYKVDLFSVGVMIYEMVQGINPFYEKEFNAIIKKNLKCKVEFEFKSKKVTEELVCLLKGIIVRDPKERMTVSDALQNFWFTNSYKSCELGEEAENNYHKSFVKNIKDYLERQKELTFNVGKIKPKDFHKSETVRPMKSMSNFKTLNSSLNSQTTLTMVSNNMGGQNLYQSGYSVYEMNNAPLLHVTPFVNGLNNTLNSAYSRGSRGGKGSSTRISYVFLNSKNFEESIDMSEEGNSDPEKEEDSKMNKGIGSNKILEQLMQSQKALDSKILGSSDFKDKKGSLKQNSRSQSVKRPQEEEPKQKKKVLWLRKKKRKM